MASKTKAYGLNGVYTGGIYSDMTVDGPEIGTLVVIVNRAKNLPNKNEIGKQDPYCVARLGKEAKKTITDRRGGQTPRWDQELRFTVYDSPDYYQLKVLILNDNKKIEIIGETWVNLQDVIVLGGGQNDLWHNLNCKGKYAGGIRIEITYYDSRPKQEKAPLPSDPVTGALPPQNDDSPPRAYQAPSAIPDHVQTPGNVSFSKVISNPFAKSIVSDQRGEQLADEYVPCKTCRVRRVKVSTIK
jgi:hypothetical protein